MFFLDGMKNCDKVFFSRLSDWLEGKARVCCEGEWSEMKFFSFLFPRFAAEKNELIEWRWVGKRKEINGILPTQIFCVCVCVCVCFCV